MLEQRPLILVVEDNIDDEHLTLRALSKAAPSAAVHVVRDGEEAVVWIKAASDKLSLVLLDLKLPKRSGHEVLSEIRSGERTRAVPVVVFSSSDERHDVDLCYTGGANTYVKKPVEYADYVGAVELMARYWFGLARLPLY